MSSKSSKGHAVVVMPSTTAGLANLPALRLWLSRGQLRRQSRREELLNRVLTAIGHVSVSQGLAALRLWGQTGDRPEIWVSAADPVYLEPMLDHLRLHALRGAELPAPHLRTVYDHLLRALGIDGQFSLARIGQYGYLRGDKPIATASMSAAVAEGGRPDELMPQGTDAVAHDRLQAELQMSLHDHPVNIEREAAGMRPVNSLWLWGGGVAPQQEARQVPVLFTDDPLFRGYWHSCGGVIEHWPGDFEQCLQLAGDDIVVVTADVPPGLAHNVLDTALTELQSMLRSGRLGRLKIIFRDGLEVTLRRMDALKFWRRNSPLMHDTA